MREIKFRAWNKIWEMMSEVSDIEWERDENDKIVGISCVECLRPSDTDFFEETLSGEDVILMQYTGLKDRQGKEIYEGDIIAFVNIDIQHFLERTGYKPQKGIWIEKEEGINKTINSEEKVIYERKCLIVEWQDDLTGFYPFADSPENCGHCGGGYSSELFEVVGNIYEHKHLLN